MDVEIEAPSIDKHHDKDIESCIVNALTQYFEAVNSTMQNESVMDIGLITCLTATVAADIAANYNRLETIESLKLNYNYLNDDYIHIIHSIMSGCVELKRFHMSELWKLRFLA